MQLFLLGYIIVSICEIFTVGGFPLDDVVRRVRSEFITRLFELTRSQAFVAVHIASIVATTWILMLNGIVGYQLLDDGTPVSLGLMLVSAALLFIGVGYIALDTGFSWTDYWESTLTGENRGYALYTLYQLVPLLFLVIFFLLEAFLVLRILGERKPMSMYLSAPYLTSLTLSQCISLAQLCSLLSAKYSSMSSVCTSATVRKARLTEASLKHYLRCWP